jgi:septum site-determining protein MinC
LAAHPLAAKNILKERQLRQKTEESFKLKANFLPITVLKFLRADQRSILQQLKETQKAAPNYFQQSPVILDFSQLKRSPKGLDLAKLSQLVREYQLIPVGVQGLYPEEEPQAQELGLALWRKGAAMEKQSAPESESESELEPESKIVEPTDILNSAPKSKNNLIITKPVRSGMQVRAKETSLVILAPVSSGAECIADGDIFCYAPVRGRMLAGASGNTQAQIFCLSLEAELISIAGYYLLYDECPADRSGHFQIFLKDSRIYINNLLERSEVCLK